MQNKRKNLFEQWKVKANAFEKSTIASEDKLKDSLSAEKTLNIIAIITTTATALACTIIIMITIIIIVE